MKDTPQLKKELAKLTQAAGRETVAAALTRELRAATWEFFKPDGWVDDNRLTHALTKCQDWATKPPGPAIAKDDSAEQELIGLVRFFGPKRFQKLVEEIQAAVAWERYENNVAELVESLRPEIVSQLLALPARDNPAPEYFTAIKHKATRQRWANLVCQYGPKVFTKTATAALTQELARELKAYAFNMRLQRGLVNGTDLPMLLKLNEYLTEQKTAARDNSGK